MRCELGEGGEESKEKGSSNGDVSRAMLFSDEDDDGIEDSVDPEVSDCLPVPPRDEILESLSNTSVV